MDDDTNTKGLVWKSFFILSNMPTVDLRIYKLYTGLVYAYCTYRSIEMAQRLRMEAVQHMTSKATQMSQNRRPNIQKPCRSLATAKTITKQATKRSLMASETMNKLPTFLNVLYEWQIKWNIVNIEWK